jgi:hypothetical protein
LENPIFGGTQPLSRNSSLLAAAKEGEELIYTSTITKEEEGARGHPSSSPRAFIFINTLSTISIYPLYLLANMMCNAIYHLPMIFCISMSLFE